MTAWIAKHGLTSDEYQNAFNTLVHDGYRLSEVSGYAANGQAHYAAIFRKIAGTDWSSRHGMTSADYQAEFDARVHDGYRLVDISAYSINGQPHFAAIFNKSAGPAWVAYHGMTSAQYQAKFDARVNEGYRLLQVCGYAVGNSAQYAAIFEHSTGPAWVAHHGLTEEKYRGELHARRMAGYRLRQVSGYTDGGQVRYAAIFEQSTAADWVAYHAMTSAQYQTQFDKLAKAGYRLDWVTGYVAGSATLYAAIWLQPKAARQDVNLLKNPGFNQPGVPPTLMVVDPDLGWGSGDAAAPEWKVWNNAPSVTTSALVPSTRGPGAGTMLQICTDAPDSGLAQFFSPQLDSGPPKAISSVWVYVLAGKVGLGTGNEGATGDHDDVSMFTGQWELLFAPNAVSPANMFVVYALGLGGACYFVDKASVVAA